MIVRIAIYDPNEQMRKELLLQLKHVLHTQGITVFADLFDTAEMLVGEVVNNNGYDAVFLETDENGRKAAYRLRRLHYHGEIVFCSAKAEFAVEGYDVGACGYLLKPYRAERLLRLVQRLTRTNTAKCLTIRQHRAIVRVGYHTILFIESCNNKCLIHGVDGVCYTVYYRLDELERELDDNRFLRSHQSFLVNMDHVVKVDNGFVMADGTVVAIRKRDHRRIREQYAAYIARNDNMLSVL